MMSRFACKIPCVSFSLVRNASVSVGNYNALEILHFHVIKDIVHTPSNDAFQHAVNTDIGHMGKRSHE